MSTRGLSRLRWRTYTNVVLLAAICTGLFSGCGPKEQPSVEAFDVDSGESVELPGGLSGVIAESTAIQSEGLKAAITTVHHAYNYTDANGYFGHVNLGDEFKLIAVDVSIENYYEGFDLDDIDLIDVDTGDNFGSDPHLEGVVRDGVLADIDDPEVWQIPKKVRVLLVYGAPRTVNQIRLGYWGEMLTAESIALELGAPPIAKSRIVSFSGWKAGSISEGYDEYLGVLEVENWYRNAEPGTLMELKCGEDTYGDLDRFVEIDDAGNTISTPMADRPHLLPKRRFLMSFWVPTGCSPQALRDFSKEHPIQLVNKEISPATMEALRAAEFDSLASHRLTIAIEAERVVTE